MGKINIGTRKVEYKQNKQTKLPQTKPEQDSEEHSEKIMPKELQTRSQRACLNLLIIPVNSNHYKMVIAVVAAAATPEFIEVQ